MIFVLRFTGRWPAQRSGSRAGGIGIPSTLDRKLDDLGAGKLLARKTHLATAKVDRWWKPIAGPANSILNTLMIAGLSTPRRRLDGRHGASGKNRDSRMSLAQLLEPERGA